MNDSIHQIAPFPFDLVRQELTKYRHARICFAQEEHKNGGAFEFVKARLHSLLLASNDERINHLRYVLLIAPCLLLFFSLYT